MLIRFKINQIKFKCKIRLGNINKKLFKNKYKIN
jgi:hypothetical protein